MKIPVYVSIALGALGAVAAYLVTADPAHAGLWQTVAGAVAVLVPVAHKVAS